MYHDYDGNQVAGWNRLTQDLIDNGTYITGTASPLDFDGDGKISHQEYNSVGPAPCPTLSSAPSSLVRPTSLRRWRWSTPAHHARRKQRTRPDPNDTLDNQVLTLYLDFEYDPTTVSEDHQPAVLRDSSTTSTRTPTASPRPVRPGLSRTSWSSPSRTSAAMVADFQFSPSIRYTDFDRGQDYINEYFDRRDLSQSNAERDPSLDTRLLATQINDDYSEYQYGDYTMYGLAFLGDFTWDNGSL
jgi:iron complex outermembrane receptor protein